MCGIVGYAGGKNSSDILISGLKNLEYRGYDSAGIAVFIDGYVTTIKSQGRIANLEEKIAECKPAESHVGIGHTRWATHGAPSDRNSHPHSYGKITVVHNGIIENYSLLKSELIDEGEEFASDTDSEVIAHLINKYYDGDPVDAIYTALARLRGSYALGILFEGIDDKLFAVRRESPLIVGIGEGENFIASDIPAVLSHTRNYYLLETNELAIIESGSITLLGADRQPIEKDVFVATWDVAAAQKDGYPHYMLKEINEQPKALTETIVPRLAGGIENIFKEEMPDVSGIEQLHIVACGSAMHAGMVGKHAIERFAKIPVSVEVASEFRYRNLIFRKGDAVVLISQSGETADTLAALRIAKAHGLPTIAIVNVVGSSIAREADIVLYTWAGPEIAVATTKAYTCQVAVLLLLALRMANDRNTADSATLEQCRQSLTELPAVVASLLENTDSIEKLAQEYKDNENLFFIGRGVDSALCWEASIKLKEISYIHSEAYAAGELKHGTISLIEEGRPVVAIASDDNLIEKTVSNVKEVKARGAKVILLCREGHDIESGVYDDIIEIPNVDSFIRPVAAIVPLQLFAYHISCKRGLDVDKPRNLAKSVTVE
ncbi:MAG: glutamine--fructose-6-phosphate transaminase (isomerizing) [Oscillospiraceae bacterium]|jgi:glucosamine--fructose-6-phosphate aminotransferase (isomerizing)|nr:glutamine--fructose-6-phosphate transaminase (isomerizing) [Oscillospiraceae bacterium]